MAFLRRVLSHPVVLAVLAILAGIAIHHWTGPLGDPGNQESEISRNLPAVTSSAGPVSGGAPAGGGHPGILERVEERETSTVLPESPVDSPVSVVSVSTPSPVPPAEQVSFREIWAYLLVGEEGRWLPDTAVTDVGIFAFRLDPRGRLVGKDPTRTLSLARQRGRRAHLVVASSGQKSLLHFLLNPQYGVRDRLLDEISGLSRKYSPDGIQLNFEGLLTEDREAYCAFLWSLRSFLPRDCVFSVTLPARTRRSSSDPFQYWSFAGLADRFLIMVYDEHWSGGSPGSISSKKWHDRVVAHALKELPRERIIIGLPFYGRIWQLDPVARAIRHSDLSDFMSIPGLEVRWDAAQTHSFTFREEVSAEGWFEDAVSLHAKFSAAAAAGIQGIGFWRLGQEDPEVWKSLRVE